MFYVLQLSLSLLLDVNWQTLIISRPLILIMLYRIMHLRSRLGIGIESLISLLVSACTFLLSCILWQCLLKKTVLLVAFFNPLFVKMYKLMLYLLWKYFCFYFCIIQIKFFHNCLNNFLIWMPFPPKTIMLYKSMAREEAIRTTTYFLIWMPFPPLFSTSPYEPL